jgi:hypothetical protein
MKTIEGNEVTRRQIAKFAQYCMPTDHGVYDKVMQNDTVFDFWRQSFERMSMTVVAPSLTIVAPGRKT